jgi:hypothetical protein
VEVKDIQLLSVIIVKKLDVQKVVVKELPEEDQVLGMKELNVLPVEKENM